MSIEKQLVALEGLLEGWAHECVTRARAVEDGEVDPKEGQIHDEREDNEATGAGGKVVPKILLFKIQLTRQSGTSEHTILWPLRISKISHRSTSTQIPTVAKVKRPTILQPSVHARLKPVAKSQNHQRGVNSLQAGLGSRPRMRCRGNRTSNEASGSEHSCTTTAP